MEIARKQLKQIQNLKTTNMKKTINIMFYTISFSFLIISCENLKRSTKAIVVENNEIYLDSCGYFSFSGELNQLIKDLNLAKKSPKKLINILGTPYLITYTKRKDVFDIKGCGDFEKQKIISCDFKNKKMLNERIKEGYLLTICYRRGKCTGNNYQSILDKNLLPDYVFQFENNKLVLASEFYKGSFRKWLEFN